MTALFFLFSLCCAWWAFNLYKPIFSHAVAQIPSFAFGWLTGEMPLHFLALQALITMGFSALGATEGFWGTLGLGLCFTAWAALIWFHARSFSAKYQMQLGLVESFGKDFDKDVVKPGPETEPAKLNLQTLIHPFQMALPQVELINGIPFSDEHRRLKLNIYRHRNTPKNAPVLFQIHGGGWVVGSKDDQAQVLMNRLAANGWVCVSINYRLSPKFTFPTHIIDCKRALVWVKEHIAEYGGNPDFIIATGGSAGGHLCSLLSLTANQAHFQPGFETKDTRVRGCVAFYGIYDFSDTHGLHNNDGVYQHISKTVLKVSKHNDMDAYKRASPLHNIHPDAPPFLILQGENDTLVSAAEARLFADKLAGVSRSDVTYVELEAAQHAFEVFYSVRCALVVFEVERYVNFLHHRYQMALKKPDDIAEDSETPMAAALS